MNKFNDELTRKIFERATIITFFLIMLEVSILSLINSIFPNFLTLSSMFNLIIASSLIVFAISQFIYRRKFIDSSDDRNFKKSNDFKLLIFDIFIGLLSLLLFLIKVVL